MIMNFYHFLYETGNFRQYIGLNDSSIISTELSGYYFPKNGWLNL